MKFIFVIISSLSFLITCYVIAEDAKPMIIDGEDAAIENYPFMSGIWMYGVWQVCSGSIISSRSVLTAAHCIMTTVPGLSSISVGSSFRNNRGGIFHRTSVIMHPDYQISEVPFYIRADIAIMRTITTIRFNHLVQPISLGRLPVTAGNQVLAIGFGLTGENPDIIPDQLQKLDMSTISNLRCSLIHIGTEAQGLVSDEKLCVVAPNDAGPCSGDSGGPLIFRGTVVGVACWTLRPCGSYPTAYIRVANHLPWIQRNMI